MITLEYFNSDRHVKIILSIRAKKKQIYQISLLIHEFCTFFNNIMNDLGFFRRHHQLFLHHPLFLEILGVIPSRRSSELSESSWLSPFLSFFRFRWLRFLSAVNTSNGGEGVSVPGELELRTSGVRASEPFKEADICGWVLLVSSNYRSS